MVESSVAIVARTQSVSFPVSLLSLVHQLVQMDYPEPPRTASYPHSLTSSLVPPRRLQTLASYPVVSHPETSHSVASHPEMSYLKPLQAAAAHCLCLHSLT
jgi:hypothetical protein